MDAGASTTLRVDRIIITLTLLALLIVTITLPVATDTGALARRSPALSLVKVTPAPRCPAADRHLIHQGTGEGRTVSITFDDGPGPHTAAVLEVLRKRKVRATFFVIGDQVPSRSKILQRMVHDGHSVGNHTYTHRAPNRTAGWTASNLDVELRRTQKAVSAATGAAPCVFRPPGGVVKGARRVAREANLSIVLWSVDTQDWAGRSTSSIRSRAAVGLTQRHPVLLLHDGGDNARAMLAALPGILDDYRSAGYKFTLIAASVKKIT